MAGLDGVGTPTSGGCTAGDIIQSIREQIPDPTTDPAVDGPPNGFSLATLIRWINDAMRVMASMSPIILDWGAFQSEQGQDVYVLPSIVLSVEQLWYDTLPCVRSPAADALFVSKVSGRAFYFGPYSLHATPRLHVWPCADRTGATTTLSTTVSDAARTFTVADSSAFKSYGYFALENEQVMYRTNTAPGTFTQTLRGQAGSVPAAHTAGATVTENNIFYKCSRLPTPITAACDPIEIPIGLTPLIELYVLAKVREAEQDSQLALAMRREFQQAMEKLQERAQYKGIRQGIQVGAVIGADLWRGRVWIP